jgi:thiol-disulfide isomerase/thioredoxin
MARDGVEIATAGDGSKAGANNGLRSAAVLVLMIAAISLLIWAGVHNARDRRLAMQKMQDAAASRAVLVPDAAGKAGATAASDQDAMTPKLQGKPAPGFTLVDLEGKKVSLAELKGKPVLVNFWATWCAPCKLEMPWFEEFHKKYADQGLVIVGIAADDASKKIIGDSVTKLGVTYPILLSDGKVTDAYGGVDYLPESFYVDRSGKVILETAGMSDGQGGKDEIEANIKKLIAAGGA